MPRQAIFEAMRPEAGHRDLANVDHYYVTTEQPELHAIQAEQELELVIDRRHVALYQDWML
jgi:hypothetical protein